MGTLLESIHSPADLKSLSFAQMSDLAQEIREFLIQTLSKTGGHLGQTWAWSSSRSPCTRSLTLLRTSCSST